MSIRNDIRRDNLKRLRDSWYHHVDRAWDQSAKRERQANIACLAVCAFAVVWVVWQVLRP